MTIGLSESSSRSAGSTKRSTRARTSHCPGRRCAGCAPLGRGGRRGGGGRAAPGVSSSGHRPTICQIHSLSKSTGGRRRGWNAIPSWDGPLGARPLAHRPRPGAGRHRPRGAPPGHAGRPRYWRLTFWWAGAALAGAVHHGVVTYSDTWSGPSWAVISMMVVVAVSYLLAASVVEVLGPGRGRVFWSSARPGWSPTPAWRSRATPG